MNKGLMVGFQVFGSDKHTKYTKRKFGIRGKPLRPMAMGAIVSLILLVLATIFPLARSWQYAEAAPGTATAATTSLTLDTTQGVAAVDLLVTDNNGTFATSSDASRAKYTVYTNNVTGYELKISAKTSSTDLTNSDSSCKDNCAFTTIGTAGSTTGVSADAFNTSTYNGKWGYMPSTIYNTSTNTTTPNTNYLPSPSTSTTTLAKTTTQNGTTVDTAKANADDYYISIGARADYTKPAGVYSNTYILQAVGNTMTYAVTYADDTGDSTVANLPYFSGNTSNHTQTGTTSDDSQTSFTLKGTGSNTTDDAKPTRTGYTFSKWCLGTVSNNGTTCTGTQYSAGASFGIDQTTTNNSTLYALWTPNAYSITLTNTNATTSGSTSARVTYNSSTVYGGTSGTASISNPARSYTISGFTKQYSSTNATVNGGTSVSNKTYSYGFAGWWTAASGGVQVIDSSGALVANTSYTNASKQWTYNGSLTLYAHWNYGSVTLPTIVQTNATYGNATCGWSTSNASTATATYSSNYTITSTNAPTANMTLYGVCTFPIKITFAGSGVSSVAVRSGSTTGTLMGTVSTSGSSVSGLKYGTNYYLVPSYTSTDYELSSWAKNSTYGTLSSTTAANPYITVGTTTTTGAVGVTITGKSKKTYMQDFTKANCQSLASSANYTVYDRRDDSDYTVRYINDACWMTQNLRITGTISSTDSNFSTKSSWNVIAADLKGSSYSYTQAQSHVANADDVSASSSATGGPYTIKQLGAWYNYCAASAGTVCSQTKLDAGEDICPSGWHLPSYNTAPGSISGITSSSSAFSPIYGGYYVNGSLNSATTYGYWWSSTAYNANNQYYLYYYNGSLNTGSNYKGIGIYVRCVRSS